jgi:hypothetical protein
MHQDFRNQTTINALKNLNLSRRNDFSFTRVTSSNCAKAAHTTKRKKQSRSHAENPRPQWLLTQDSQICIGCEINNLDIFLARQPPKYFFNKRNPFWAILSKPACNRQKSL